MKPAHILAIVAACVGLLGAMMPLAVNGIAFVSIQHLNGSPLPKLLYLFPIVVIGVAVLSLNGKQIGARWWYVPIGVLGFLVALLTTAGAKAHVGLFGGMLRRFGDGGEPSLALGAWLVLSAYVAFLVAGGLARAARSEPTHSLRAPGVR